MKLLISMLAMLLPIAVESRPRAFYATVLVSWQEAQKVDYFTVYMTQNGGATSTYRTTNRSIQIGNLQTGYRYSFTVTATRGTQTAPKCPPASIFIANVSPHAASAL